VIVKGPNISPLPLQCSILFEIVLFECDSKGSKHLSSPISILLEVVLFECHSKGPKIENKTQYSNVFVSCLHVCVCVHVRVFVFVYTYIHVCIRLSGTDAGRRIDLVPDF